LEKGCESSTSLAVYSTAVMGDTPSRFDWRTNNKVKGLDTSRFPVETVSWSMICEKDGFLDRANAHGGIEKVFGKGAFALPHEDQWEYACRGGKGNGQPFYWGNQLNGTEANINGSSPYGTLVKGTSLERTRAVDALDDTAGHKYEPHPWGLMHMHGNVWEWCSNTYDADGFYVLRGGSWFSNAHTARAAHRYRSPPHVADDVFGCRLCLRLD
jgi:formylglycine-generating enzyme required for sulfatase activity